jgi:uncharacterized protein (TIGR02466 family)
MQELYSLFPTPVLKVKCDIDCQNEIELLLQETITTSTHYSLNNQLLTSGKYPKLHDWIYEKSQYFASTYLSLNTDLRFTQSWLTQITDPVKQWINPHIHRNSFISGVFYIEKIYGDGDIRMWKPKGTINTIEMPSPVDIKLAEDNVFAQDSNRISAESGELLLFPAYIPHSISTINSTKRRTSLGFDLLGDIKVDQPRSHYDTDKYGDGVGLATVWGNTVVQKV